MENKFDFLSFCAGLSVGFLLTLLYIVLPPSNCGEEHWKGEVIYGLTVTVEYEAMIAKISERKTLLIEFESGRVASSFGYIDGLEVGEEVNVVVNGCEPPFNLLSITKQLGYEEVEVKDE